MRHLRLLATQLGDDLLDAIAETTDRNACRRADGIAVVPAALLGPSGRGPVEAISRRVSRSKSQG